jgi:hypothetical protein
LVKLQPHQNGEFGAENCPYKELPEIIMTVFQTNQLLCQEWCGRSFVDSKEFFDFFFRKNNAVKLVGKMFQNKTG